MCKTEPDFACFYCGNNGGLPVAEPESYCDTATPGYAWKVCGVWVAVVCTIGPIV